MSRQLRSHPIQSGPTLPPNVMRKIYGTLHPGAQRAVARAMRLPSGVARPAVSYAQGGGKYATWWREGVARLTALADRLRVQSSREMQVKALLEDKAALVELKKNYKRGAAHMEAVYSEAIRRRRMVDGWRDPGRFRGMTRDQIADQVLKETQDVYDHVLFQLTYMPIEPTMPAISQAEAGRRAKAERARRWGGSASDSQMRERRRRRIQRRSARRAEDAPAPPAAPVAPVVAGPRVVGGNLPVHRYVPGQGWQLPTGGLTNAHILAMTAAAQLRGQRRV